MSMSSRPVVVIDECRLDMLVETTDGRMVRPVVSIVVSEDRLAEAIGAPTAAPAPYNPGGKGAIERALRPLAEAIAQQLAGWTLITAGPAEAGAASGYLPADVVHAAAEARLERRRMRIARSREELLQGNAGPSTTGPLG